MADTITNPVKLQSGSCPSIQSGASVPEWVEWLLRLEPAHEEIGVKDVTIGVGHPPNVPNAASAADILLGKRYILCSIMDPDIKSLLQPLANGPAIIAYIKTNLMGGRDTQAIIQEVLDGMFYDGASIISFYGRFCLFINAVQPAVPAQRKCLIYSSKFGHAYLPSISACDQNPGHGDFTVYAAAVNQSVTLFGTRTLALEKHTRGKSTSGLHTSSALFLLTKQRSSRESTWSDLQMRAVCAQIASI